jgi:hypothetical protein
MNEAFGTVAIDQNPTTLTPEMITALALLLQAADYAQELRLPDWEFAVHLPDFRAARVTTSAIRWLSARGYVKHAQQITQFRGPHRKFRPVANLTFTEDTCFILTPEGKTAARNLGVDGFAGFGPAAGTCTTTPGNGHAAVPHWDAALAELRLGNVVVKKFCQVAPNQQIILAAFEEEGWPARIDDPLPQDPDQDPKERLRETVRRLNEHQHVHLIRFRVSNCGQAISWERIDSAHPHGPAHFGS